MGALFRTVLLVSMLQGLLGAVQLTAPPNSSSVEYDVACSSNSMMVTLTLNNTYTQVYLENLKDYPGCKPETREDKVIFNLPLDNIYVCGMFKMENKMTGDKIFYHRIIIHPPKSAKEVVLATCFVPGHHHRSGLSDNRTKRNTLPENFSEPEFINITQYIEARAPVPYLNIAVRQNGRVVDTALNVPPGTPLEMLIFLDDKSKSTYGLLASYMKVTDNSPNHEETIVMNGCSIDPYIFGNFESQENGDRLSAKFRAFKFPESNYVLFSGTVNICLQQCKGIPCGNGQLGYGRRKREIPSEMPYDPNKIFEVEMTAYIKVIQADKPTENKKGSMAAGYDKEEGDTSEDPISSNLLPLTQEETDGTNSASLSLWSLSLLAFGVFACRLLGSRH